MDAAEELFVEEGLARTSLRAVTLRAGVNVAAVHYHFGSKEALLEAVFARRVEPANRERIAWLDRIEAAASPDGPALEAVLEAFIVPMFRVQAEQGLSSTRVSQLIGRFYAEPQEIIVRLLGDHFAEVSRRFLAALGRAVPALPPGELTWRFQFVLAVITEVLSGRHLSDVIPGYRVETPTEEATTRRVIAFAAAGLRAPLPAVPA